MNPTSEEGYIWVEEGRDKKKMLNECREVVHLALALHLPGTENKPEDKQLHAAVKQGWDNLRLIIYMVAFPLKNSF